MRLALVALALVAACSAKKEPPAVAPPPPKPLKSAAIDAATPQAASSLEIRADRRVELVSIINYLAGYPEYGRARRSAYTLAVEATFRRFDDQPAVRQARDLRQRSGIGHDAPMIFAVHLDDGLALARGEELPELDARWRTVDATAYAAATRDFAQASRFDEFFAAHAGDYARAADRIRALVGDDNPVGFFEDLFGVRGRHVVVPGLLAGLSNFGVRAGDVMYQILGDEASLGLLVHEMAHSYINPLFAEHAAALEPAGKVLYPMFEQRMRAQSYATWQTMLNEAGVRALTVLFLRERKGEAAGAAAVRAELRAAFPYLDELVEVLRRLRRDRARYPRFASYMPEVIAFFDQLAKRYVAAPPRPTFLGPFDAVLAGNYVLALPALSADDALASYARKLPFFAKVPQVAPAQALAASPDQGIVAYGTPATNAVIARVADEARWKLTSDGIELGAKKLTGKHLVLIATWFRRDAPARGIAVYAAASEADLVGINNLRHGSSDWLVARATPQGYEVVEAGDWPIEDGAWVAN